MPLPALATVGDLEARLGRALAGLERTRAEALLKDASATIRAYTGQQLTPGSSTIVLRARGGVVRLPQRPVTAITDVEDLEGTNLGYAWETGGDELGLEDAAVDPVKVTYSHGYEELPGELLGLVCQVAGRALGTVPDQSGLTSETIGNYSYSIGGTAAAGPIGLLEDELRTLEPYRRRATTAWLGSRF